MKIWLKKFGAQLSHRHIQSSKALHGCCFTVPWIEDRYNLDWKWHRRQDSNILHLCLKWYRLYTGITIRDKISKIFWYFSLSPLRPARLDRHRASASDGLAGSASSPRFESAWQPTAYSTFLDHISEIDTARQGKKKRKKRERNKRKDMTTETMSNLELTTL